MKVNQPDGPAVTGLGKTQDSAQSGHSARVRGGRSDRNDQVQLSSLSSALGALQTDSPERVARLTQLSVVVGTGGYHVDAHAISGSILQETLAAGAR